MTDHPNADELLQRDIQNVITFFDRRFKVKVEIKDVCDYVTGKSRSLMV
jgi:RIO-like serine/threonine protein kinase